MLWWNVVGINWLTLCQECCRAVFCPYHCSSFHLEVFSILENMLIGYADNSTLLSVVQSPGVEVTVTESLNRDLSKVSAFVWAHVPMILLGQYQSLCHGP